MKERWLIRNPGIDTKALSERVGVSELSALLCANRGFKTKNEIQGFLNPSLDNLHSAYLMKDCLKGATIIKDAIINNKKIVIYGDYDCDGVISTYILYSALKKLGANHSYYIPHREEEGYGMNSERIVKLKEEGYEIILTCDNGISAFEQVDLAKSLGFTVVISDHHDIPYFDEGEVREYRVPKADAIINPKQLDCKYPFKLLCGAGVAIKFVSCLYDLMGASNDEALELIEYGAIATVCDVVDLIEENRIIVKHGLKMLNNTKNVGLKALFKETSIENKKIGVYHLGFVIGPEINASGRLETATLALELLLEEDQKEAEIKAAKLHGLNAERQRMTQESVLELEEQIQKENRSLDKVLLLYNPKIHESIAGIAAGRIKEKYNKPTIVLTKGKDMPKGSGRSIEGYNIFEELSKGRELMEKFGGHPMAAGLSLKEENISPLRNLMLKNCSLTDEDLIPKVRIDSSIRLEMVGEGLIEELETFEPFGKGNPSPLFGARSIKAVALNFIGKEKNILKLRLEIPNKGIYVDGISFDKGEDFKELINERYTQEKAFRLLEGGRCNIALDLLFYPAINEYNGYRNIQLIIKNIRLSE